MRNKFSNYFENLSSILWSGIMWKNQCCKKSEKSRDASHRWLQQKTLCQQLAALARVWVVGFVSAHHNNLAFFHDDLCFYQFRQHFVCRSFPPAVKLPKLGKKLHFWHAKAMELWWEFSLYRSASLSFTTQCLMLIHEIGFVFYKCITKYYYRCTLLLQVKF